MEKKMIIAIALSMLILLGFQMLSPKKVVQTVSTQAEIPSGGTITTGQEAVSAPYRSEAIKETASESLTEMVTDKYRYVFSDIGGSLKTLYVKGEELDAEDEVLLEVQSPELRPFSMQSPILAQLSRKKFDVIKGNNYIEYKFTDPGFLEITKTYKFHKAFDHIELSIATKNLSDRSISFSYKIIGPSGLQQTGKISGRSFLESNILIDDKIWKAKSVKVTQERMGNIAWVALKNRYFTAVLKPFYSPKTAILSKSAGGILVTALTTTGYDISPSAVKDDNYVFYGGPLDVKNLAELGYDMQKLVNYGFFGSVSKVLLSILEFFHKWTKNWGIAIILLTILINIILFPLTYKSFSSMQQMRKLQPHMNKLKDIHKDNPQKLNKEMMELYKKYKVNPLGGCFPMILQMPIFISLYQGLMRFIGLKGAHFLWIKDLAKPDAVPLPFSLPVIGASVNVLPLFMVGMMVVQQKISQGGTPGGMTGDQASQQKMMMIMMPIVFGFLFYKMPSGLVLYWLTNTILMTIEQTFIAKRMAGAEI